MREKSANALCRDSWAFICTLGFRREMDCGESYAMQPANPVYSDCGASTLTLIGIANQLSRMRYILSVVPLNLNFFFPPFYCVLKAFSPIHLNPKRSKGSRFFFILSVLIVVTVFFSIALSSPLWFARLAIWSCVLSKG